MWKLHFPIPKTRNVDRSEESYFPKTPLVSQKPHVHLVWREGVRAEHLAEICGDPPAPADVATTRTPTAGAHPARRNERGSCSKVAFFPQVEAGFLSHNYTAARHNPLMARKQLRAAEELELVSEKSALKRP